ncbi:MAG: glycosyltransferase family 4 protein [Anaerolineaceae bacterium]|nr:glycosyltransferase family 4 protein [Anaerolineaceae bacterium]
MELDGIILEEKKQLQRCCMIVYATYPLGETRVQREAELLLKHGYEVDVICLRLPGELPEDRFKGVGIYRQKYRFPILGVKSAGLRGRFFNYFRFFSTAAIRVTRLHLKNPYNVIQVHNLPDFLAFSAVIPKLLGVPVILDLHDLMPEFFAGRFKTRLPLMATLINWQERLSCKFADHVITVSEHWRQALIRRGVPEQKCSVIMNVADDAIFHTCDDDIRPPHSDHFRLIYHGSIHERYGLDLAVEAIDKLRDEIPNIHLTLIGNGEFLPEIVRMVDKRGLKQYVTIEKLHLVEELPGIIRSYNLGVVPYKNDVFTDGLLPTKLMEYAALGLPAVASRTTAIQAYFSGTNTEFFEPGNADDLALRIRYLYDHPARLAQLSRGSQNFNQLYNWTKVGSEYVELVERVRRSKIRTEKDPLQPKIDSRHAAE